MNQVGAGVKILEWPDNTDPVAQPDPLEDLKYRASLQEKTEQKSTVASGSQPTIKPSVGTLLIEDNGATARLKAWENHLLQVKREEAAIKVKTAIATAEAKAEYERVLAKVKADMKKRGRKQ